MGVPRYNAAVDGNQVEIVKALRDIGLSVAILREPCDIAVGHRDRTYLFEIKKDAKAKRTPNQIKFERTWRGHFEVVWTLGQILDTVFGRQALH